jgi:hypothetical protein
MGAFTHTYGPIDVYARLRNGTAAYLGTTVAGPEPEAEQSFLPVINDLGGRSVPFQVVYDGAEHLVTLVLNRFDYSVWSTLRALTPGGLGADAGVSRGTLVLGVYDFELILIFTYKNAPAAAQAADMPAGRRYYSARIEKYRESTQGTRVTEVATIIRCSNLFNPTTRAFGLFTESDFGSLPAPN